MTLEIKRGEGQKGRLEGFFGVTGSRACSVGNTYGTEVNAQEILERPVSVTPIFCLYPL